MSACTKASEMLNYVNRISEARSLGCTAADESEPFKNRYAAADTFKELQQELQQLQKDCSDDDSNVATTASRLSAWCQLERGLQLLETDLLAEGQKALEEGLSYAWPATAGSLAIQQQAHNALASLWCDRSEHDTALSHLESAVQLHSRIVPLLQRLQQQVQSAAASGMTISQQMQEMHLEQPQQPQQSEQGRSSPAAMQPGSSEPATTAAELPCSTSSSTWESVLVDADTVDRDHTTTLFYMAQVHGLKGNKLLSASYCAATLNRQLKQGTADLDVNEWVQNCLQLSGCFLDCNTFALSRHCCSAVEALLLQQHHHRQLQAQPEASDTSCCAQDSDKSTAQDRQQPGQQEHSSGKDQTDGKDQAAKQQQQQEQQKDPPNKQQQQQQPDSCVPGGPSASLLAALSVLDADVAANVCLAFAKLQLYTLVASHEAFIQSKQVSYAFSSAAEVPAVLCFDALPGLVPLSSLPWGRAALVSSYDQALPLFKAGLQWFKAALEHYQLDGWVTEHCNILFEMSNLYRCLAGFEADTHKRCVMHRARAKLLQPLEGQLSPTHYPGLSRSISLELGNICREVADIKAAAGREADKVASAMQSAAGHYKLFLDSFRDGAGQLPHKVEPEMEEHYLGGLFSSARMLQGLPATGTLGRTLADSRAAGADKAREEVVALEQAILLLQALVAYVQDNEVLHWQEQADMARELSALLGEKLNLVRHLHEL